MYASVWNRVALLAAGLAFGWNLVHYWSGGEAARRSSLIKLLLGLAGGLLVIGLMARVQPGATLAAGLVFLLTAFVAYAGNARQVNRAEAASPQEVERPGAPGERVAVLLAVRGEPPAYDGPGPWARRFAALAAQGEAIPHWLRRPWVYSRIRQAYQAMGGENATNRSVAELAQALAERLGADLAVRATFLETEPTLATTLAALAQAGVGRILIVPLTDEPDGLSDVHEQVARSRAREVGLSIRFSEPHPVSGWSPETGAERLRWLCAGRPLPAPEPLSEPMTQALLTHVQRALVQA